jgi:hypothetical protein
MRAVGRGQLQRLGSAWSAYVDHRLPVAPCAMSPLVA